MVCARKLRTLLHGPAPARAARDHTARCLHALGASREDIDDATLAVSELAANAEEHAVGPIWLQIWEATGWAFVHVNDSAPHLRIDPPTTAAPTDLTLEQLDALGGDLDLDQHMASLLATCERRRGLGIVTALYGAHWGVSYGPESKVIWFALRLRADAPKAPTPIPSLPILAPLPISEQEDPTCRTPSASPTAYT